MKNALEDTSINHIEKVEPVAKNTMDQTMNVYIWDMDETLILLKSLLNGTYADAFNGSKNIQKGIEIGKMWEEHILRVCDDHFFYEQIEDYSKPFLDALKEYDDGRDLSDYDFTEDKFCPPHDDLNRRKLAYRHRYIADKYTQGLHRVLDQETIKLWDDLYDSTDSYTDKWLSSARTFLEQCSGENKDLPHVASSYISTGTGYQNTNVLVTSGSLIPSLVKCLLFRLDDLITTTNVYSSWEVGKLQCFSWIKERFDGPNVRFCVIGDGGEECEAAQTMGWPFIRIDPRPVGFHRFPGLTVKTIGYYLDVVYGVPKEDDE